MPSCPRWPVSEIITSRDNPAIKLIRSLAEKKHRQEQGLFVAEGAKVIARAREAGWEAEYLVATSTPNRWGAAKGLVVDERVMASLSAQNNASPILGVFRQRWATEAKPAGVWLALEDIRDPGNLGTIIRTADAVAASGIILAGNSCDPWGPVCVRATMGSIFGVALVRMTMPALIDLCRAWPGEVAGTSLEATADFRKPYGRPTLVVIGSEGAGLSPQLAEACSTLVRIPMPGKAQSLNVAAATALMLYEAVKP